MRRIVIAAGLGSALLATGASSDKAQAASPHLCEQAKKVRASVIVKHGKRAPGRDICRFGVRRAGKVHAPSNIGKARYLRALKRLDSPPRPMLVRTAVPPRVPPAGTRTPGVRAGGTLAAIARCESGGNYATNTGNGFYGAYQFDLRTWQSVGGSGNPAAASPAEQDRRAAMLYAQRGSSPWPVCGR
jgi:hypothetical protein